jgi:hypothetical protein
MLACVGDYHAAVGVPDKHSGLVVFPEHILYGVPVRVQVTTGRFAAGQLHSRSAQPPLA